VDAGFKHVHVAPIPGVLHTLDGTLEHPTASDAFANSAEVERRAVARMARHRSASVVLRDRSGYEAPQPSAEEHVAHIERLGAIAGIHGLTPDPQQFAAPEVPASVIERHAGGCRSWMSGVVHPMPQALDGPPGTPSTTNAPPSRAPWLATGTLESRGPRRRSGFSSGTRDA
jgi:hypothetical protein